MRKVFYYIALFLSVLLLGSTVQAAIITQSFYGVVQSVDVDSDYFPEGVPGLPEVGDYIHLFDVQYDNEGNEATYIDSHGTLNTLTSGDFFSFIDDATFTFTSVINDLLIMNLTDDSLNSSSVHKMSQAIVSGYDSDAIRSTYISYQSNGWTLMLAYSESIDNLLYADLSHQEMLADDEMDSSIYISFNTGQPVPLPGTLLLIGSGFLCLTGLSRKYRMRTEK